MAGAALPLRSGGRGTRRERTWLEVAAASVAADAVVIPGVVAARKRQGVTAGDGRARTTRLLPVGAVAVIISGVIAARKCQSVAVGDGQARATGRRSVEEER